VIINFFSFKDLEILDSLGKRDGASILKQEYDFWKMYILHWLALCMLVMQCLFFQHIPQRIVCMY